MNSTLTGRYVSAHFVHLIIVLVFTARNASELAVSLRTSISGLEPFTAEQRLVGSLRADLSSDAFRAGC
jgi:hypothetical protein